MGIYVFIRDEGFYPLELGSDEEAILNAEWNPGTKMVILVTAETQEVVYEEPIS